MVPNTQQAGNTTSLKRPGTPDPGGPVLMISSVFNHKPLCIFSFRLLFHCL